MSEETAIDPVLGNAPESAPEGSALEQAGPDLRVRLSVFEGPLDLLLYLIKKEELDIYDIPVERITTQYLSYLQFMKMLDLEVAGEYLVVASTLLYIKSRTLLPKDQQPPEDEAEEDDPRWDLIRQLVEYKKFKDAAWQLHMKQLEQGKTFQRGAEIVLPERAEGGSTVGELGIFDLINAFQKVLARVNQKEDLREIFEERFTVGDKINSIQQMMHGKERIFFEDLFIDVASRTEIVVTFLALLELIRLKFLCVSQADPFAEIEISHTQGGTPLFQTASQETVNAVAHEEIPPSLELEGEIASAPTIEPDHEPVNEPTAPDESEVELEPTDFPEEKGTQLSTDPEFTSEPPDDSEPVIIVEPEPPQAEESEAAATAEAESTEKNVGEPTPTDAHSPEEEKKPSEPVRDEPPAN